MASTSPGAKLDPRVRRHVTVVTLFVLGILAVEGFVGSLPGWYDRNANEGAGFLLMALAFAWPVVVAVGLILAVGLVGGCVVLLRDGIDLSRTVETGRRLAFWVAPAGVVVIGLGAIAVFGIASG